MAASRTAHVIRRRGAFDIGSGSTKLQVSDCEVSVASPDGGFNVHPAKICNELFGLECPVPFGADWMRSENGLLSEAMQQRGLSVLSDLKAKATELGVQEFSAIATEVFRKASNGDAYLNRVRMLGIPVTILTQPLEAELAYKTVHTKASEEDPSVTSVWDSGGASFQITTLDRSDDTDQYKAYMGSLGTGITTGLLIKEIRGRELVLGVSPNPVTADEVTQFSALLTSKLPAVVPDWLKDQPVVACSFGSNSIFKVCCSVLSMNRPDEESLRPPLTSFTLADAERAVSLCIDKQDSELERYTAFPNSDGPFVIIPKLVLLVAVMRHTGIKKVISVPCVGSCGGLLSDNRFWPVAVVDSVGI